MTRLPPKRDVALALLEQSFVFVHLDPRADTVRVPPWFKKQPQLVLQIGLNMAVPIPDLSIDEEGLSCTLSFNRSPHFCRVPWNAIYALVGENGRGMVWPDDVPPEVAAQVQGQGQAPAPARARGHLRSVAEAEGEAPPAQLRGTKANKPAPARAEKIKRPRRGKAKAAEGSERAPRTPADNARPAAPPAVPEPAPAVLQSRDDTGNRKQKRELPPYLRVVK